MAAVVSVLRTSLVAVPALSRVEPASTSGPGAGAMMTSAGAPRVVVGLHATRRSEERRVGKECRYRRPPDDYRTAVRAGRATGLERGSGLAGSGIAGGCVVGDD